MKRFLMILALAAAALACAVSCKKPCCDNKAKVKHVIVIGLDGWGSRYFADDNMPFVHKMMEEGAWTLTKRSVYPTASAMNWGALVSGVDPILHGFIGNTDTPTIPPRVLNENGHFPTMFSLAREAHPDAEIGLSYMWRGILPVVDTAALSVYEHFETDDEGAEAETVWADKYLKEKKPLLAMFYFDMPDGAGHSKGWGSPEYHDRLTKLDALIERIVNSVKEAGIYDDSVIILTTDHGGTPEGGHGGPTIEEIEGPLLFIGKSVKKGYELQSSIMQFDIGSTVTWLLGLKQPQVWVGRPVFEAFGK